MFDMLSDFPLGKCFKRLHLKFYPAHFGDIGSNRKLIFENGLYRKWKPEIRIWMDMSRSLAIYNRSPLGHCPITCQFRKINILGATGQARIVRRKLFRSVTVKTAGISRRFEVQRIWFVRCCGFGIDIIWFGSWNVFQTRNLVKLQEIF